MFPTPSWAGDVLRSYSWNSNRVPSKSLEHCWKPFTLAFARWQQKPQFSLPPPPRLGCWWCQCRTWVWLVWWQWSGHWNSMDSSAFVSSSCWTLTATASAALQAGLWRPHLGGCRTPVWVLTVLTRSCRSHTAIPLSFLDASKKSDLVWFEGLILRYTATSWYMIHLDTPWYLNCRARKLPLLCSTLEMSIFRLEHRSVGTHPLSPERLDLPCGCRLARHLLGSVQTLFRKVPLEWIKSR